MGNTGDTRWHLQAGPQRRVPQAAGALRAEGGRGGEGPAFVDLRHCGARLSLTEQASRRPGATWIEVDTATTPGEGV